MYRRQELVLVLMAAVVGTVAASAADAASRRAEIGKFAGGDTIKLHMDRFQDEFGSGERIVDLRVDEDKGYVVVRRKGYTEDENCRVETARILNASGQPIPAGYVAAPGTPVFLANPVAVTRTACEGDGRCHALKNVPPGLQTARCDITEVSDNKCACHIDDGTGLRTIDLDFCYSWFQQVSTVLVDWVRLQYIVAAGQS